MSEKIPYQNSKYKPRVEMQKEINTERLITFLETHITGKYKNKLIILDNASSHRNQQIKDLVNKHNNILYAVPYQHLIHILSYNY